MNKYPLVRNVLSSCFSIQTGLEDSAAHAVYRRAFTNNHQLRAELQQIFVDEDVKWTELLFNSEYEVFEAESEAEAKTVAFELLAPNED